MIRVKSIHIYPIKGMEGSAVDSAKAKERGFEHDRRYMLIDASGAFISQRTHPELVFFKPEIKGEELRVSYQPKQLRIPLNKTLDHVIVSKLFNNEVQGTEVSKEANEWFSSILGEDVRLIKMLERDVRYKQLAKSSERVEVSFADGYPYLILGDASVQHLNARLEKPIKSNRFRPNILLETSKAHIEDSLTDIRIGNVHFSVVKPCARCQVITVDQETSIRSKEPLKTLSTYRKIDKGILFGVNAICREEGEVHIGDEVVIL